MTEAELNGRGHRPLEHPLRFEKESARFAEIRPLEAIER